MYTFMYLKHTADKMTAQEHLAIMGLLKCEHAGDELLAEWVRAQASPSTITKPCPVKVLNTSVDPPVEEYYWATFVCFGSPTTKEAVLNVVLPLHLAPDVMTEEGVAALADRFDPIVDALCGDLTTDPFAGGIVGGWPMLHMNMVGATEHGLRAIVDMWPALLGAQQVAPAEDGHSAPSDIYALYRILIPCIIWAQTNKELVLSFSCLDKDQYQACGAQGVAPDEDVSIS